MEGAEPAYVRYPVCVEDRAAAQQLIAPHAVVGLWFTSVLEEAVNPVLAGYTARSCPIAERVSKELINLPTHSHVTQKDIEHIARALAELVPEAVGSRHIERAQSPRAAPA
jgi:dTDP-4-amino-4,6-dideoxygalactose transaminase